eukprot:GHVU01024320.1.p1 GENE.GHVU01024320.1~~GHVU01024320.1.p1  ORF type:complete len:154 (+),score=1.99 GHVU01024320.1:428-889(+)
MGPWVCGVTICIPLCVRVCVRARVYGCLCLCVCVVAYFLDFLISPRSPPPGYPSRVIIPPGLAAILWQPFSTVSCAYENSGRQPPALSEPTQRRRVRLDVPSRIATDTGKAGAVCGRKIGLQVSSLPDRVYRTVRASSQRTSPGAAAILDTTR